MPNVMELTEQQTKNFWSKVHKTDACWLWLGSKDRNGYGQVRLGARPGRLIYSHRLSYEIHVGVIEEGLVIDHLCKTPACLNPEHLEQVTQAENVRRGKGNGYREKTHCIRGHEFTPENTRRSGPNNTFRQCITCKITYDKARWESRGKR